jgi:hypothetical protein
MDTLNMLTIRSMLRAFSFYPPVPLNHFFNDINLF